MDRFVGLLGMVAILSIAFLLSTNRRAIKVRTVAWGLGLQLALAFFVLRTDPGRALFQWLGTLVTKLLDYTKEGSGFVFGSLVTNMDQNGFIFAFQVLPAIIFVGSLAGIFYYLGIMQFVVSLVARVMMKTMGTSGAESLYAVGTVFVGQSEAPLLIRPYIENMTKSELNAIMTAGMSTIAGSVLFAYVGMLGEQWAPHLLAASIMGAPAGLVLSKILYPETEVSATGGDAKLDVVRREGSLIEAAAKGASDGMHLALLVGTMLIAFIALIATLNGMLGWVGGLFGYSLSMQMILGWLFSPLAWLMGVPWDQADEIGRLVGQKIVLNEFVAYSDLSNIMAGKATMEGMTPLSEKAITIATFALCGFANFSSIGINIGCIGGLAPTRQADLAQLGFRAMLGGALASSLTACLAGMLL